MNVHYVDDDDADLAIMLATTKKLPDISLTTSRTLETLFDRINAERVDCILLDIYRPDTTSLENDLDAIRQKTNVPVILLTSGFANDYRVRATLAGADGVIEKSTMSRDLLDQVLKNARARLLAQSVLGRDEIPGEIGSGEPMPLPRWLDEIHATLDQIEASLDPVDHRDDFSLIQEVRASVSASKKTAAHDPSVAACVPMSWALNAALEAVGSLAEDRDVALELGKTRGTFFPKGPRELGYKGFHFLLDGMVRMLGPGESIEIKSDSDAEDGCVIDLHLSAHSLTSKDAFFEASSAENMVCPPTSLRLRLAALLLGVSRQKISINATVESQNIRVAL